MSHSIILNRNFLSPWPFAKKFITAVLTIWNWLEILWIILTFYLGMKENTQAARLPMTKPPDYKNSTHSFSSEMDCIAISKSKVVG